MIWASIMTCTCCEHEIKFHSFIHSSNEAESLRYSLINYPFKGAFRIQKCVKKTLPKQGAFYKNS